MPRRLLKRLMPDPETIRKHPTLRIFQHWLNDPNLWHLNRYSASSAVFIAFLVAFVPLPIHMLTVTLIAIWWRANLPVALAAVWLSNPVTIPAQFFLAYEVGTRLLNEPEHKFAFELSLQWARAEFNAIWQPLLLGCLICGLFAAFIGAGIVRLVWRMQVIARWKARQHRRHQS